MFGPVSWGVEQITGTSLSDLINDQLGGWAEFDVAKREVRLSVDELLEEQASEDPQSTALIQMLLRFIKENELLVIGFKEGNFSADLELGRAKAEDEIPPVLPEHLRINSEEEFQAIMASKATTLLLSTLTLQSGQKPYNCLTLRLPWSNVEWNSYWLFCVGKQSIERNLINFEILVSTDVVSYGICIYGEVMSCLTLRSIFLVIARLGYALLELPDQDLPQRCIKWRTLLNDL
jgi:hypothetical protein